MYPTKQNNVTLDNTVDCRLIIKETVNDTLTTTIVPTYRDQSICIDKTDAILTIILCDGSDGLRASIGTWHRCEN